jgi:hypothetical protein
MTKIAICAPASPITREAAEATKALVADEFPMHSVVFHEQCFARSGHFAGDDLARLTAFLELANDPSYDAIWFARGGYGSNRIAEAAIPRLNEAARAKTYVGFSDCGATGMSVSLRSGECRKVCNQPSRRRAQLQPITRRANTVSKHTGDPTKTCHRLTQPLNSQGTGK